MACECVGLGSRLRDLEQGGGLIETEIDLGFRAEDWLGGDEIRVIRSGVPLPGEIGPHGLLAGTYQVDVWKELNNSYHKAVGVTVMINRSTGEIRLRREGRVVAFSGRVVINYAKAG